MTTTTTPTVLRKKANWRTLHFYQKADTLYQLTLGVPTSFVRLWGERRHKSPQC